MSLTSILLIATAILCLLTGFISLAGSTKNDRSRGAWFFVTTIGCAIWTAGCGVFQALSPGGDAAATGPIFCIYLGSLLMAVSVLGYAAWRRTSGKICTVIAILWAIFEAGVFIYDQSLLYTGWNLTNTGNSVQLYWGWYYISYVAFFCFNNSCFIIQQYLNAKHGRTKKARKGDWIFFIGLTFAGILSIVFNLFLPPTNYSLIWVGPLTLSIVMIAYFYATLKYRMISIKGRWLQLFAYGVLLAIGAVIYMLIFYIIFTALFRIPNPSGAVLFLNFLMIIIVLLLMPVLNEVSASFKSMIKVGQIDVAYVVKKLDKLTGNRVNLRDLAGFLAEHLHFSYVGFVIKGRVYGSRQLAISAEELKQITAMRLASGSELWQEPNKVVRKTLDDLGIHAVAELRTSRGRKFGQMLVGKPLGKTNFERRELIQLEMIINLVATVIDSEKRIKG